MYTVNSFDAACTSKTPKEEINKNAVTKTISFSYYFLLSEKVIKRNNLLPKPSYGLGTMRLRMSRIKSDDKEPFSD